MDIAPVTGVTSMDYCPTLVQLEQMLSEALADEDRVSVEGHIETCRQCQETLEQLTHDSVVGRLPRPTLPFSEGMAPMPRPSLALTPPKGLDATEVGPGRTYTDPTHRYLRSLLAPPVEPETMGRLDHFAVLEVLGKGGMGIVAKARDSRLERVVALKFISPQWADDEKFRARFLREARANAAVRHEHVVSVHAVEDGPVPYLVMEYVAGSTLEAYLERMGPLPPEEVVRLACQMARGLEAAHATGLVHRDVKPANILREERTGCLKITDFGLARAMDAPHLSQSGTIAGTPLYMAPEQARGERVDHRSDLFSLGSVLYRMCTGEAPFISTNSLAVMKRVCEEAPRPIRAINPLIPGWLAAVVARLHAKQPEDRFASAAELANYLEQRRDDPQAFRLSAADEVITDTAEPGILPALSRATPARKGRRRSWRWWVALVVLLGVVGTCAVAITVIGWTEGPTVAASFDPQRHGDLPPTFIHPIGMEFVLVPAGTFWMGGSGGKVGSRQVTLDYPFYIGKYEVTQVEWKKVMRYNASAFARTGYARDYVEDISDQDLQRFPVEMVSWDDALDFAERLNASDQQPGWMYRLPLETEWECACRGGPNLEKEQYGFDFYSTNPTNELTPAMANVSDGGGLGRTCKVGSYPPNRLGLYDIHGNVNEWCRDYHRSLILRSGARHRGGSYEISSSRSRTSAFGTLHPRHRHDSLGLRVVRIPVAISDGK